METQFTNVEEYGQHAEKIMKKMHIDYYQAGADDQYTLNTTKSEFAQIKLKARALSNADIFQGMETTILGHKINSPLCMAPAAFHKLAHPDGEVETAKAAESTQTMMCLSSWSSCSLEEVAAASPSGLRIFQIYFTRYKEVNRDLFERVEKAGYKALAITVDAQVFGNREVDVKNKFSLPPGIEMGSLTKYIKATFKGEKGSGLDEYVNKYKHNGFTWSNIAEVRQLTKLPIILKGIQCAEDAKKAVEYGADAIWVSNHGGRQLDTTPASIEVLEECAQAVDGKIEVYFDGGVRRGTDILKAIALGARAVFIGRPYLWGLACNGQKGVEEVLHILNQELRRAMILTDCKSVKEITKERVIHTAYSNPKYFSAKL